MFVQGMALFCFFYTSSHSHPCDDSHSTYLAGLHHSHPESEMEWKQSARLPGVLRGSMGNRELLGSQPALPLAACMTSAGFLICLSSVSSRRVMLITTSL